MTLREYKAGEEADDTADQRRAARIEQIFAGNSAVKL